MKELCTSTLNPRRRPRGSRHRLLSGALCALLVALAAVPSLGGCGGASGPEIRRDYAFPAQVSVARQAASWFDGELEPEALEGIEASQAPVEALFVAGEVAWWAGDVERAFEMHRAALERFGQHPLTRYSAARLYDLREEVVDFADRLEPVLAKMRFGESRRLPLTSLYLSMLGQYIANQRWHTGDSDQPFEASALGYPVAWLATPRLSPYRLRDFDRAFPEIEAEGPLAERYRMPYFAEEDEINLQPSRPYQASGVSLAPGFAGTGVYYLETWMTLTGDEARDFWAVGNFAGAARVWIDGRRLFERREDGGDAYDTGKRLRRVRLEPGTYRVLVKLGFQRGYRSWFDLSFLGDHATPLSGSELAFSRTRPSGAEEGEVMFATEPLRPSQVERVLVDPSAVENASDVDLYLTTLSAVGNRQASYFDAAWQELMRRHEGWAPGHALRAEQIQTLWEVPSRVRDAESLKSLRAAQKLDEDNLHVLMRLGQRLGSKAEGREVRKIVERARDLAVSGEGEARRVRNIVALNNWGSFLERQGMEEQAEHVWREALALAPSNCAAARNLQSILHGRRIFPEPSELTPAASDCPELARNLVHAQEAHRPDEKFELIRRSAHRYPYDASAQLQYARALEERGQEAEARAHLEAAIERMPEAVSLYGRLAQMVHASEGKEAAAAILDRATEAQGHSGWLVWRRALLDGEIPLDDLMQDGREAALAAVSAPQSGAAGASTLAKDDAHYVIDFAARRYFEDGSSVTLTHTLVRVMTKGAIDRFGETTVPQGAQVLAARTIKQDGRVLEPEQHPGKGTLSMPALAEGDFVELAYLTYDGPSGMSRTYRDGVKFFFRMDEISSLHSEFVVINPGPGEFVRRNGPPEGEEFTYQGLPAVRFVRKDSARPRSESYSVAAEEYLPWLQLAHNGVKLAPQEQARRFVVEALRDSLKVGPPFLEKMSKWTSGFGEGMSRREKVERLFYTINDHFPDAAPADFETEVSHAVLTREGSPLVVLKAALDQLQIDSEIYRVKPSWADPFEHPLYEFARYNQPLLRVDLGAKDGGVLWLDADGPDAMFGAVSDTLRGQPGICVSCTKLVRDTVPAEGAAEANFADNTRSAAIDARLDAKGTLHGELVMRYDGELAVGVRRALRARPDETSRRKFFDSVLAGQIQAATLGEVRLEGVEDQGEPVTLRIAFERPDFARPVAQAGVRAVQDFVFREPLASIYGKLPDRTTPLMIGYDRDHVGSMRIELPEGAQLEMRTALGPQKFESPFGVYERDTRLEDGALLITSELHAPIQRVSPEQYERFRQWAMNVEQSSLVVFGVKVPGQQPAPPAP